MRSEWLCSRNDVGNLAVLIAASGVFATGTAWPDLAVAMLMSPLYLTAMAQVVDTQWKSCAVIGSSSKQSDPFGATP